MSLVLLSFTLCMSFASSKKKYNMKNSSKTAQTSAPAYIIKTDKNRLPNKNK